MPIANFKPPTQLPELLEAVRERFKRILREELMKVAEAEVNTAVEALANDIDWKAELLERPDRWDSKLVIEVLDKRRER